MGMDVAAYPFFPAGCHHYVVRAGGGMRVGNLAAATRYGMGVMHDREELSARMTTPKRKQD
jgi:hypothetical protein